MDKLKPEGVTIKQMIIQDIGDTNFIIVGLGSDDKIYVLERSTSCWENLNIRRNEMKSEGWEE